MVDYVGIGGLAVVSLALILGAWAYRTYITQKESKTVHSLKEEIRDLEYELKKAKGLASTYKSKWNSNYIPHELEPNPDEYIDPEAEEPEQLSALAESIGLRIPKPLKGLIDNPTIQEWVLKKAADNPNMIAELLGKFTSNAPEQRGGVPVAQPTNTPPQGRIP